MIDQGTISCMITDVIRTTLDTCDWQECSEACGQYLWRVAWGCPAVFNNLTYRSLWDTLNNKGFSGH